MTDRKAQDVDGCFLSDDHGMRNSHDGNPNKNTVSQATVLIRHKVTSVWAKS